MLNEVWKNAALEDFIKRMLVYYDPMGTIALGAPHDEYDLDVPKIKQLILRDIDAESLSKAIFEQFRSAEGDNTALERMSKRMAEDLIELKNS